MGKSNPPALIKRLQLKEFTQPDIIQTKYPMFLCHGFGALGSLMKPSPLHDPAMLMREHGVIAFAPNVVPKCSPHWALFTDTKESFASSFAKI